MAKPEERAGWGGQLITFLETVANREPTKPAQERVVTMPRKLEELHASMRKAQNDLTIAQTTRGQIEMAWNDIVAKRNELIEENEAEQRAIIQRWNDLQVKWIEYGKEVGIRGEIIPPEIGG
jgi:chromosome segregation ATPase